ncbi:MAG: hypothetical protein AAB534_02655 [Patescibacteria group bacterium]
MSGLDQVVATYPQLKWKVHPSADGKGRTAYAVVSGNRETGELWVMAVIENCTVPKHRHNSGGKYGEMILTISGALYDTIAHGHEVIYSSGSVVFLPEDSVHAPHAVFWHGLYHQPRGSTLVE